MWMPSSAEDTHRLMRPRVPLRGHFPQQHLQRVHTLARSLARSLGDRVQVRLVVFSGGTADTYLALSCADSPGTPGCRGTHRLLRG